MSKDLQVTEFNEIRILTTQQLSESYVTSTDTITKNFNRNKERYQEGKHYIALEGEEKNTFINQGQFDRGLKNSKTLYLWTEKGAFLHAKSLNTDKAWEVYDELVETYFRGKKLVSDLNNLSPQLQLLINIELKQKQQDTLIAENKQEIQNMRDVITLSPASWRKDTTALINKIAMSIGGFDHIKDVREESYKLLNERFGVDIKTRLTNKRRRMADEGVCKSKRDKLTLLDVIADDKKLIEGYIAIVKEMSIKNNVA
ncbi:ORF6N domain-containing protein [Alkalibaculum sp. M08DMB]|uniref:ORF6N domain-containing protein n=1 Tax=Alkalibaculum sporogenes TaxID=2655001 RepID=A0A6A7KAA3_9FIRM|nr:ORF6N domain-containing protein [Alkalibaculum sporogenes]MPW26231.1 ORF6N domain-containing protein [Alkalibaculum sporogenes]